MTVADRIKGRSKEQRIKQRDWAKLFKITPRTWQNWLNEPENITIGRLRVIAARLDTTPAQLIGEEE